MKKRLLTVLITALAVLMLVACGESKEASSDSAKEKKEKVESEVEKDTAKEDKNNTEFSGDGGAPVVGEETETNTEADTEAVEGAGEETETNTETDTEAVEGTGEETETNTETDTEAVEGTGEETETNTETDTEAVEGTGEENETNPDVDIEVAEPVANTFTLMGEDGIGVVFEGSIPDGLTLVDGNGTGHIEFAYDECPDVSVYLDAGLDYDVLSAMKCNTHTMGGSPLSSNVINYADSLISFYNIPEDKIGFNENMVYEYNNWNESCKINDTNYRIDIVTLENLIYSEYVKNDVGENAVNFFLIHWNRILGEGKIIPIENPDESEFGYLIVKGLLTRSENGLPVSEPTFTISLKIEQPDVATLTDEDIVSNYYNIDGYSPLSTPLTTLLEEIAKSF